MDTDPSQAVTDSSAERCEEQTGFDLRSFFPFLVRIYYRAVSSSVAQIYGPLFGLSASEWRTIVVLGPHQALSSSGIVERSSMDKVNVSRAIAKLRKEGLLKQGIDEKDRRRSVLRLTDKGREAYATLVPLVLEQEQKLLEGLTSDERDQLVRLMERVRMNAEAQQQ